MRKQIAAANWKMNLTQTEAKALLEQLIANEPALSEQQMVMLAVPFPYLSMATEMLKNNPNYVVAAQDVSAETKGAFTGEVSAEMLSSLPIPYVLIGHSERRAYHAEDADLLLKKMKQSFTCGLKPVFCCGEPLEIREANIQNDYVAKQLADSLFSLTAQEISNTVIAYEPIWAIGTGKTATSAQAQEMHAHIRSVIASHFGETIAQNLSILYGGSVKASNADELFSKPDVDGGLVGGASLQAAEFTNIIKCLGVK